MLHVYLLYTTFGQTDRNTVVVLRKYAYLNVFIIIIILFNLSKCVRAYQLLKKLEITTPLLFSHIHTNSIHPTDPVSKCKTNMPQNKLIIVDFLIDLSPSRKTRIDNWT